MMVVLKELVDNSASSSSSGEDPVIYELREKHRKDRNNLTLLKQPIKTLQFFTLATVQNINNLILYILKNGGWITLSFFFLVITAILLIIIDGPHDKHVDEALHYARFGLWWIALGVASSIGLGSGLHTFVLYLGPHIALFTLKSVQCGHTNLKSAPYDTIQLNRAPSWLDKTCRELGPPLMHAPTGSLVRVPVMKILAQVQLEAVLWGIGTALGELPPYFISRAARFSGERFESMEEMENGDNKKDGFISKIVKRTKNWLVSNSQRLNFITILVLASVPNPLFDLAGIMCGQFGVPFWKFFIATLTGKALFKTHIQTIFIISLCNNSLLEFVETKLIWLFGKIPGFSRALLSIVAKLDLVKDKLISTSSSSSQPTGKKWNLSFTLVWNTVIWLMVVNFFVTIVTSTAQKYLKNQQDLEMADKIRLPTLKYDNNASVSNSNGESES
ncbi:hypothetical protein LUZ60_001462 [Juncus effusus]|nr:hypothetical protein LUZ60_001462 [Juncus effusus]